MTTFRTAVPGRLSPRQKTPVTQSPLAPRRMVGMSNAPYVIGADLTDNLLEIRHLSNLSVHRILDVILTERKYRMELPEASPDEFGLPWHEPHNFRIFFKPGKAVDYVREGIWSENKRFVENDDESLSLELTTRSEPELQAGVRSFGDAVCMVNKIYKWRV
jgi:hypothetical protein